MNDISEFGGFHREVMSFFSDLKENDNREWFALHKDSYTELVVRPAQEFVVAVAERLLPLAPNVVADTLMNGQGCIARIYHDTRFSKDKRPYKNFLSIFLWEGGKKWENPGFYFHLGASKLMLATGIHAFTKPVLEAYREAVANPTLGPGLEQAVDQVKASGA